MQARKHAFRFKLYPTGEFSATKVRETAAIVPLAYAEGASIARDAIAAVYRKHGSEMPKGTNPSAEFYSECVPPLGLSNVPKNHKPRKARGRKGMTSYGKRLVRNSTLLLEKKYGRNRLSFLTLTLPPECEDLPSETYGEVKRQMFQWLHRRLVAKGLPQEIIGCTELQGSRFANSGAVCLHEHWVFVGRQAYSSWSLTPQEIQYQWLSILSNVCNVAFSPAHSSAACNIQRVKKSVSAYLGKYLSKSETEVAKLIESGHELQLPSSWVSKTGAMLKMFRQSISILKGENAIFWLEYLSGDGLHLCRWKHNLYVDGIDGTSIWVAFVGYLSSDGLALYRSLT